jgi:hypothetical protein
VWKKRGALQNLDGRGASKLRCVLLRKFAGEVELDDGRWRRGLERL